MKKTFATPIDEKLQNEFKAKCKQEGYKMNEVVEMVILMVKFKLRKKFLIRFINQENKIV